MPEDNQSAYKEMYEMGERLMQMAKDGGYSPDTEEYSDDEGEEEMPMKKGSTDKIGSALSIFGNG